MDNHPLVAAAERAVVDLDRELAQSRSDLDATDKLLRSIKANRSSGNGTFAVSMASDDDVAERHRRLAARISEIEQTDLPRAHASLDRARARAAVMAKALPAASAAAHAYIIAIEEVDKLVAELCQSIGDAEAARAALVQELSRAGLADIMARRLPAPRLALRVRAGLAPTDFSRTARATLGSLADPTPPPRSIVNVVRNAVGSRKRKAAK